MSKRTKDISAETRTMNAPDGSTFTLPGNVDATVYLNKGYTFGDAAPAPEPTPEPEPEPQDDDDRPETD